MTTLILAGVIGLLVGGGAVGGVVLASKKSEPVAAPDTTAKGQADAVAALTNLDILKEPCGSAYIEKHGDGLCREMYCLAQSNSTTGGATEKTCDAVANLNNSLVILEACATIEDGTRRNECYQTFRERK